MVLPLSWLAVRYGRPHPQRTGAAESRRAALRIYLRHKNSHRLRGANMGGHSSYQPKSAFGKWFHERLPVMDLVYGQALDYPTPKNLNYWWTFGGILSVML